jgi:hypothetical protein
VRDTNCGAQAYRRLLRDEHARDRIYTIHENVPIPANEYKSFRCAAVSLNCPETGRSITPSTITKVMLFGNTQSGAKSGEEAE